MIEVLILKRILLAALLGGIIGFERERAHKVAGLRTHVLVCVSATLLTLMAIYGFDQSTPDSISRIIANVILGVGFIGGGAIVRQETHIMGTTTAATLWTVAAIGLSIGVGFTFAAVLVTLLGYLTLTILWRIEVKMSGKNHQDEIQVANQDEHRASH